jgi:hypothetical protein
MKVMITLCTDSLDIALSLMFDSVDIDFYSVKSARNSTIPLYHAQRFNFGKKHDDQGAWLSCEIIRFVEERLVI